jgi:hypothetical protein
VSPHSGLLSVLTLSLLDILLKLEAGVKSNTRDCGEITVRFWKEDASKASTGVIADARKAVETKLETRRSATKSLENVVSKIKMFTGILGEMAKVYQIMHIMIDI